MILVIILTMAAVVAVLLFGIVTFMRGGTEESAKRSNQLMIARVVLQAVAIGLLALMMVMGGKQ